MNNTFRTEIEEHAISNKISYTDPVLMMGSCFTDHIGNKLKKYLFPAHINPFGVLYNPVSICNSLNNILEKKIYTSQDLIYSGEYFHSLDHYSGFSGKEADSTLKQINQAIETAEKHLLKSRYLFLSLGTSWVYEYIPSGKIVANCHKIPAQQFNRFRLTPDSITKTLSETLEQLKKIIPNIEVIFTVSPIRHLKDGLIENNLSKSTLRVAIDQLQSQYPFVHYFPSFEIIMDDLRDYRFYDRDMVHINDLAIDYIWNYFQKTYMKSENLFIIKELDRVIKAREHKIQDPSSENTKKFLQKQIENIDRLSNQYPFLQLQKEKDYFSSLLNPKK